MRQFLSATRSLYLRNLSVIALVLVINWPNAALAQGDGPRFYWKGLNGTNAVPVIGSSLSGNANPMDPSHNVFPGASFEATMAMVGYAKMLPVFKRAGLVSVIMPMGRLSSDVTVGAVNYKSTARGFGDPMLQFSVNIIGPKPIMNIPDMIRYKPKFSVDLLSSLAIPIGEYDNSSPINIGQNRWYGRIGAPIVWQLGAWVPGRRTTLEFLPAVWLFSDNNDFVGKKMHTEPMYQVEAHLTRDFMERLWGSLDVTSYSGGKATIDDVEGNSLNNIGVGGTLGYHINDNMQMNASYSSTINDNNAEDLKMDGFRITLIWGWHKMIEGMQRLKNE
ncbi:transporter [Flavihumibacter fluvii]|uniref:transporter n=1 Tax=Flavihumibacter fluvii TaxID=2838157 RepID=UPI001BDEA390|nr:transporter [Flavihumibacter fluvii]ULQ50928.1 transporter [Flavihumibacter fluvii]